MNQDNKPTKADNTGKDSNRNKKKGCFFLVLSAVGTPLLIIVYIITQFLFSTGFSVEAPETSALVLGKVLTILFLLAGIFLVIISPILGIVYLAKKEKEEKEK